MHENSIALLNKAVADELSAVNQYMYFHFHCDDQGYDLLASLFKRTAIAEMIHVEHIADRILFLKGDVEMDNADPITKTQNVNEMLEIVSIMEQDAITKYNQWAIECTANADSATRKLFESLVEDEESHFGQFDNERENLQKFGKNYLALQSMERSKNASNPIE